MEGSRLVDKVNREQLVLVGHNDLDDSIRLTILDSVGHGVLSGNFDQEFVHWKL